MNKIIITFTKLWRQNKTFRVFNYLLINGIATYIALQIQRSEAASVIFGAAINYVIYVLTQEIESEKN
jgi:hypothetical protein